MTNLFSRLFGRAGREKSKGPAASDLWPWLRQALKIRTVIDIGAHDGEFGAFLSGYFKADTTVAFEPLAACRPILQAKSSTIKDYRIHSVALSDEEGQAVFYQNTYPPASSLLRVADIHIANFPNTAGEAPVTVRVTTLDAVLTPETLPRDILIKMDVQGYEAKVIRGGRRIFGISRAVLVEMSFEEMFRGQPLFEEVHDLLRELGYRLKGIKNQICSPRDGQPLFAHCLYLRPPNPTPPSS